MNAQIRLNLDTGATEIFTGDKWVATYTQEDIDETRALWYSKGHTDGQKINTLKELTDEEMYQLLEKYQGLELCKAVLRKADKK